MLFLTNGNGSTLDEQHNRFTKSEIEHPNPLQIRNPRMHPFYKFADIKYYAGEYVEYKRETNGQER
jgi:hypothetical protein